VILLNEEIIFKPERKKTELKIFCFVIVVFQVPNGRILLPAAPFTADFVATLRLFTNS
jgi:hypothetical protein